MTTNFYAEVNDVVYVEVSINGQIVGICAEEHVAELVESAK